MLILKRWLGWSNAVLAVIAAIKVVTGHNSEEWFVLMLAHILLAIINLYEDK